MRHAPQRAWLALAHVYEPEALLIQEQASSAPLNFGAGDYGEASPISPRVSCEKRAREGGRQSGVAGDEAWQQGHGTKRGTSEPSTPT